MQFLKLVFIYIAVSTYCSQALDVHNSFVDSATGLDNGKYWGLYPSDTSPAESLINSDVKENYGPKQELKIDKFIDVENNKQIISQKKRDYSSPCDHANTLYLIRPQLNATAKMFDVRTEKEHEETNAPIPNSNSNAGIKESPKSNLFKDETRRVLNRDTDSFYDNELIQKVIGNDGELPEGLQVDPLNRDPISIYKEPHNEPQKVRIEKREAKKSPDYDYNYYEDKSAEDSSAVKGGFLGIKQKISKMMQSKEKKATKTTKQSTLTETTRQGSSYQTTVISTTTIQPLTESNSQNVTITAEENQIEENEPEEVNEPVKSKENLKIRSVSKKKDPCGLAQNEPTNCLPQGGVPKNPGIQPLGRNRDAEYDKVIRGELPEKIVKTILDKVKKNPTMSSELGVCEADFKEIKDLYNSIRNKQNECCMKLKGEFKCFLNWLLTVDPSRRKRSPRHEQIGLSKVASNKLYDLDKCPSYVEGIHRPSPQYQKLFEEVERYKRQGDQWNYSPDAMEVPDNSISI